MLRSSAKKILLGRASRNMVRVYDAQELTLAVTLLLLSGIEHFARQKIFWGLCSYRLKNSSSHNTFSEQNYCSH